MWPRYFHQWVEVEVGVEDTCKMCMSNEDATKISKVSGKETYKIIR